MRHNLRLAGGQWSVLRAHLFPGDELEAVALLLCGLHRQEHLTALCVRDIRLVPHDCCRREPDLLTWPTEFGLPFYNEALKRDLAVVKIHSHPGGYPDFSRQDDRSDREFFESLTGWTDSHVPHGSAVMLPDGGIFARVVGPDGGFVPVDRVAVAGPDLHFFDREQAATTAEVDLRNIQAFGEGTVRQLKRLRVGVAGCSGTGSWLVEMLARLGIGEIVLVDPDVVTRKNLNRIINATQADAEAAAPKVLVALRSIQAMGFGSKVMPIQKDLRDTGAIRALAGCDVLFGGFDCADGRDILNRISTSYCLPYFDVGVRLDADGQGGIAYIGGACHYLQPGGSSLISRKVITPEGIAADSLHRHDLAEYARRRKAGYIHGVAVDRPAVCSVNGLVASLAVNDFLARLHRFRDENNDTTDAVFLNLTGNYLETRSFPEPCPVLSPKTGRADQPPLLDLPGL